MVINHTSSQDFIRDFRVINVQDKIIIKNENKTNPKRESKAKSANNRVTDQFNMLISSIIIFFVNRSLSVKFDYDTVCIGD